MSNGTATLGKIAEEFGYKFLESLDLNMEVPVLTGMQVQGDVLIRPDAKISPAKTEVPREGVEVIRGEAGRNAHTLLSSGKIYFDRASNTSALRPTLGTLTVPVGSEAYFSHLEHGSNGIGPGTYRIVRQRQQAEVTELVED